MTQAPFLPIGAKILIEPFRVEKTAGGLILPAFSHEDSQVGVVLAVGKGAVTDEGRFVPVTVPVGAKVIVAKYAPAEVEYEGKKYLLAEQKDILGYVKDGEQPNA
jgi:chaperonin GroES